MINQNTIQLDSRLDKKGGSQNRPHPESVHSTDKI